MACDGNNATPPSPAIAPGGEALDPRRIAAELGERGLDPGLCRAIPGFDAPFFQAGLAGYSDAAMRIIARRHGCPMCVTEALLDITLLAGGRGFAKADLGDIAENVPGGDEDSPLVGQIMGSEPETMAQAARKMVVQDRANWLRKSWINKNAHDEPNGEAVITDSPGFAAIDVNLACPVKKIAKKARGGHWLAEPNGAIKILEAVREAVPAELPTTVKLRRSFDDTPEMVESFWRIYDAAYDMGYAWATVHARTVEQKYIGPSRWDLLREIVRARPGRTVLGSGDVWNAGDIFRMLAYTGVSAASVARGCIGNPWIFRQARQMLAGSEPTPPTIDEQRRVLEQHFELAIAANRWTRDPERFTSRSMRKFGIRFSTHHPASEAVRQAMIKVSSIDDWRALLDEHYTGAAAATTTSPADAR